MASIRSITDQNISYTRAANLPTQSSLALTSASTARALLPSINYSSTVPKLLKHSASGNEEHLFKPLTPGSLWLTTISRSTTHTPIANASAVVIHITASPTVHNSPRETRTLKSYPHVEQLVHHESLRQKFAILTQGQSNVTAVIYASETFKSHIGRLESG